MEVSYFERTVHTRKKRTLTIVKNGKAKQMKKKSKETQDGPKWYRSCFYDECIFVRNLSLFYVY